jgi:acetyltransferase-like isoleucine patch superfamily enzyme
VQKKSLFGKTRTFLSACCFYFYNSFVSHIPFYFARHFYLKRILRIRIGMNTAIHTGCFITGRNIEIGDNSVINRNSYIDGRGKLVIGSNVSISPHAYIITLGHDPQSSTFEAVSGDVSINDFAWIGARVTILPGVAIGKGAVIGAGAVVTKNIDEFSIAAGIPAEKKGTRNKNLDYSPAYFPYFNTDILP